MYVLVAALVCCVIAFIWFYLKTRKRYRLPPGPKGIPFFGNAFQVKFENLPQYISQFGKDYKHAHTISFFSTDSVVLNSYELIEELMTSPKYSILLSGRPKTFLRQVFPTTVVLLSYSEKWAAMRKLAFRGLRTYGTHLTDVEVLVQRELEQLVSRLKDKSGTARDPSEEINVYITSIILMLLTGRQRRHHDPLFRLTTEVIGCIEKMLTPACNTLLTRFPWLGSIPIGYGALVKRLVSKFTLLQDTIYKEMEEKNRHVCFMDYLFSQKESGTLDDESLTGMLMNILVAGFFYKGSATSRSTLRSLLLVLASRPDVQEKIQQEIDQVIGCDRLPSIGDKNQMPYTQAVLWETFRLYTATPIGVPHCAMEDVELHEYCIPKDTLIFVNIWHVLHDETFWEDPWDFKPSRFLDEDGQLVPPEHKKRKRMIAFGLGKRQCIGEVLARVRIFLAMAAILQKFTLIFDPAQPPPQTDPRQFRVVTLLHAPDYKVVFKPR